MITIRLSMNGESPITRPVTGSCSGAPGITVSSAMATITRQRRPQRVAQPARLVAAASASAPSSGPSPRVRRGRRCRIRFSTKRAVTKVSTTVTKIAEAIPKNRLAARSMLASGPASAAASLVISVSTPSSGVIRKFTPKPAATPANAAAIPASGWRPTLMKATAPRGISTR